MNLILVSSEPLSNRLTRLGRVALGVALGLVLSAALFLGTSPLVWAQNSASSSRASSEKSMKALVNSEILPSLPYAAIFTATLVILLCWFIFHKTTKGKGAAAKQEREKREAFVP